MEYIKYLFKRNINDYEIIDLTSYLYGSTLVQTENVFQSVPSSIRLRTCKTNRVYIKLDDTEFSDHVLLEILKHLMQLPQGYTVIVTCDTAPHATLLCLFAREIILCGNYHGTAMNSHLFQYIKELYQNFYERDIICTTQISELDITRKITLIEKTIFNVYKNINTQDISEIFKHNDKPFEVQLPELESELEKPEVMQNRLKLALENFRAKEKSKRKFMFKIHKSDNKNIENPNVERKFLDVEQTDQVEQVTVDQQVKHEYEKNDIDNNHEILETTAPQDDQDQKEEFQLQIKTDYKVV